MQQVKTCQNQTKQKYFQRHPQNRHQFIFHFHNYRWIECVQKATLYFGAKVSQVFSLKYDGNETKTVTEELIQDLRTSFEGLIKDADWMDEGELFQNQNDVQVYSNHFFREIVQITMS